MEAEAEALTASGNPALDKFETCALNSCATLYNTIPQGESD